MNSKERALSFLFAILFGAIGSGYMLYGRRNYETWFLVAGFALMIYPYFVANALLNLAIGVVLLVLPIARHREWI